MTQNTNSMDEIISIIVPIYNAEKFLASCIDSILSQTFKNFELLLIDDGSQDSSLSICQRYQQNDNRITVFHKSNEGVTAARKYGVEKAKGEYICFVDADDIIPKNSLALLYKEHDNADMIIGNFIEVMPHCSKKNKLYTPQVGRLNGIDYIGLQLENKLYHAPWGKIIRRDCFNDDIFTTPRDIFRGEDLIMNIKLGLNIEDIKIVNTIVYHYMIRASSCMQSRKPTLEYEKMFDRFLMQILKRNKLEIKLKKSILSQRIDALTGLLTEKIYLDKNDTFVKMIYSQLKISSFDMRQILLKTCLSHPSIFNILYRVYTLRKNGLF